MLPLFLPSPFKLRKTMKTYPTSLFDALLIVLQGRGGRKRELEKIKPWVSMISVLIHPKEPKYLS
jgi:hypothetical protein